MFRQIFYLILVILAASSSVAHAQKKDFMVGAVAFYNFENLFDTLDNPYKFDEEFTPKGANAYTSEVYTQKLHNLAFVIAQMATDITPDGPAIIGTAEVENETVLRDLAAQPEIKDRNYQHIIFNGPDSRGINTAMMYNPKYFKVLNAQGLTVDISGDKLKGGRTRDILFVEGIFLGDTTYVFVSHWPSRRGGEAASAPLRAVAAGVGRRAIDSLYKVNPRAKIIFMGDLNDDPVNTSLTKVLLSEGNKNKLNKRSMYNPWEAYYKIGKGTLAYQDSWNLFDQILISPALLDKPDKGVSYWKSEIFRRDFLIAKFGQYKGYPHRSFDGNRWINGYSDHLPTILYFLKEK